MATSTEAVTATSISDEYTRLHITPFNPSLLPVILPPSILPNAHNISYHIIETFPEKGYGYVELPAMDAEKIKKKLSGSILKGSKVRIERARPQKEKVTNEPGEPEKPKKAKKESKKRKRDANVIPGAEIGERSVKRGWTTPGAIGKSKDNEVDTKKIKVKSKYTTGPECLFKTVIPANIATTSKATDKVGKKKRSKPGKEAVVHEFSKTTKYATFLRSTSTGNKKGTAEFVEGKGWIDEEGNVVEVVKKTRNVPKPKKKEPKPEPAVEEESLSSEEDSSDILGSSQDESDAESAAPVADTSVPKTAAIPRPVAEDSETSSSGSSSEASESLSEGSSSEALSSSASDKAIDPPPASRPQSSSGPPLNLSIKIPTADVAVVPISAGVHPLEALYKRTKSGTEETSKPKIPSFSFFGADADNDEEMEEAVDKVPLTPFTQCDFDHRGLRSAAPTPDTAHVNKRFLWPSSRDDDEDDDDEAASSPIRKPSKAPTNKEKEKEKEKKGGEEESDFQKWFYENRGDTNRAWKKRRKVAGKEKRHRENKKRTDRMV